MAGHYADVESQSWEAVQAEHCSLLKDQLAYLASESAYYRERFAGWEVGPEDAETSEGFTAIPLTDKDDERLAQESSTRAEPLGSHQAAAREDLNRVLSSSGTTGEPTFFGLTSADLDAWQEMCARSSYANGVRPDDVVIHANSRTMVPGTLPYVLGLEAIGATVVPAGSESSERILETVDRLDADVLFSTVSHLQYLAERAPAILNKEVSELSVEKLIGGGEPGTADPEIRAALHDAWGAEVVTETMGIGDVSAAVAGECREEDGMHLVCQGFVRVELLDPDSGERVPMEADAEGELVYTPLRREATPLLRFRSGDYARVVGTDCECGRTAPRIQVLGRADDMLIYKAQNVYPAAIREVVGTVEGASPRVTVVLPRADKVRFDESIPIEVVGDDTDQPAETVAEAIERAVRERLQVWVEPTIVDSDALERSTYKTDLVRVREGSEANEGARTR